MSSEAHPQGVEQNARAEGTQAPARTFRLAAARNAAPAPRWRHSSSDY